MIQRITVILLAIGAAASLGGWLFQERAADAFRDAKELQARETTSDAEPPSPDENEAIIAALQDAIEVRRSIESVLVRIEDDVEFLSSQQEQAQQITGQADEQLGAIGGSLAVSVEASSQSIARLGGLEKALRRSTALAHLIAEELEELDRNMGPSAGGRP